MLGYPIPRGTLVVLQTAFNHEDESNPNSGSPTATSAAGQAASLDNLRTDKYRQTGFWEAGTGAKFDPDRWMRDGQFDPTAGPSLPFSGGQRGRFGKSLAASVAIRNAWV